MNVRATVARQYQAMVNRAGVLSERQSPVPPEGWVATVRKALGMSGAQLANRVGVTRARISKVERAEVDEVVTIKTMRIIAEAMGCRFVYAIVPQGGTIEDVIAAQARRKAQALVARASNHMALESQSLSEAQNAEEVERVAQDLLRNRSAGIWTDE